MPRSRNTPCSDCGKLLWPTKGLGPGDTMTCKPCRGLWPKALHNQAGCECKACDGKRASARKYAERKRRERAVVRMCSRCAKILPHGVTLAKPLCGECRNTMRAVARRRQRAQAAAALALVGTAATWPWTSGTCHECGLTFTRQGVSSSYCGKRCSGKAANRRRRARMAGAKIGTARRHAVYERDNWTCHICTLPLDRQATVPAPLAPTLDHVVALARGGAHDEANLSGAHFICNATKRDLPHATTA